MKTLGPCISRIITFDQKGLFILLEIMEFGLGVRRQLSWLEIAIGDPVDRGMNHDHCYNI